MKLKCNAYKVAYVLLFNTLSHLKCAKIEDLYLNLIKGGYKRNCKIDQKLLPHRFSPICRVVRQCLLIDEPLKKSMCQR